MRLERSYTYQVVRALRLVLPFVVLALIAIPAWRFWNPAVEESSAPRKPPPHLVEDVAELMEGVRFSQEEGGRTAFSIEARTERGFADGKHLLDDVTVVIYDEDPRVPPSEITSDRAGFDEETEDIVFEGNVEVRFDPETMGRTEALAYNSREKTIRSTAPAEIIRSGQFRGSAERMSFAIAGGVFRLEGAVRVVMADGTTLEAARAAYDRGRNRITAEGGLRVSLENGSVEGREGRADLDPETQAMRRIVVDGAVFGQATDPANAAMMAAENLTLDIAGGRVQRADATGDVELVSTREGVAESLFGHRLEATFGSGGELQTLNAAGSSLMLFGEGRLESTTIRNDLAAGTVTTSDESRLEVAAMTVTGSHFVIDRGDVIRFRTDQPSVIDAPAGVTRGAETDATFEADSGELVQLVQRGSVSFELGNRSGTADRVEIGNGGQILLTGNTSVEDDALRVEASRIALDQDDDSFQAAGSVKTVYIDVPDPVLIVAARAEGDGERIVFSRGAQLWRGNMHVQAGTIEVYPDTRRFAAITDVRSTMEDTRVWAERLDYDEQNGVITYDGGVRVRADDMELTAGSLRVTLAGGDPDRIVATDDVRVRGDEFEGSGDEAVYVRAQSTVTLTGQDAVVIDPVSRDSLRGRRLVIDIDAGNVLAGGEDGGRVVSTRKIG